MLIDNEKLIGLLVENSGLEQEKVEKQLAELVSEIKKALDENEAYEVEGFGIFSKLGNNIHFIPSDDLETEVNYKYVGMEPIELPGEGDSSVDETSGSDEQEEDDESNEAEDENPIEGLLDESTSEEYEDPFAEIFSELDEEESEDGTEEETAEPDEEVEEEEIDFSALEGDGASEEEEANEEDPFGGLDEDADESIEDMDTTEESLEEEPDTEELAPSGEFLDESVFDTDEETEEEEEAPGPDKWGIDAHKEEDTENAFAGLLGANAAEENAEDSEDSDDDEDLDFSELEGTSSDDFDDPFDEFEEEEHEDDDSIDDFVPVVTNVSSGKKAKSNKKEAAKKEDEKVEGDEAAGKLESKTPKSPRDRKQGSPVFLYMILALVILGGAGYGLAYFGIINIQGITPASNTTQQPTVAQNNMQQTPPPPVENPSVAQPEVTNTPQESAQQVDETATVTSNNEQVNNEPEENTFTPENQLVDNDNEVSVEAKANDDPVEVNAETFGLMGNVTEAGNTGYTIVLYTLSKQDGAERQYQRLTDLGYRAMVIERPSETYGVLYRVAIGQFASLADAAIAAEKLDADFLGNYLIAKI